MKKLMIAAAIVCAAVGVQAAQFKWSFEADDDMGSYSVANNATYYLVNGVSGVGAVLTTILTTEGVDAFTTALGDYSYMTGNLSGGTVSDTTFANVAGDYAALFVINDGLTSGASFAYNEYDISGNVYTPPSSKSPVQMFASDYADTEYVTAWGAGSIASVPEPTSGLLVVLGMAGMALRRRRA